MSRKRVYEYVFAPGTAGLGTVKIPGRYNLADILAIFDTTLNVNIYNFADNTLGGSVTFVAGVTAAFPSAYAGVTTITLDKDTSTLSGTDQLAIYIEQRDLTVEPWAFGEDAIGRARMSSPEALIDADFEYGLQNTKWQNVAVNNNVPGFYEDIGADIVYNTNGYITLLAGDDLITSNVDTAVRLENQSTPQWVADDYAIVISQTQGNTTAFTTTYTTANINTSSERTFSVASTTGYAALDNVLIIAKPGTGGTTVAVANITSTATTTVNVTSAVGIVDGSYVIVETDTVGVFEVMAVTNVSVNVLTVVRQSNNSNGAGANISIGNDVFVVSNIEAAQIQSVTDSTTLQLNRGWYNTSPITSLTTGTLLQKLSANVEIVQHTAVSSAVNGTQTITRGQFNTTALTGAGVGSPMIRMTGVWYASGAGALPRVGVNQTDTEISANEYVSMQNTGSTNVEGIGLVASANTNNFIYYPRRSPTLAAGYPLNQYDTVINQAYPYTGADLDIASIVSDGLDPSTITVTTNYAHGLVPGTPILVNLSSGTNQAYGEGSFLVISVPSTTTFTYTGKSGAAVSGSLAGVINLRSNAAFLPRPFDGGVVLGPGTPTRGAAAVRQTKKYFRYQSGKGILFSSGTMLKPTFDIAALSADGTASNSTITVTTDLPHGLNAGATITISGVTTSGYNNSGYIVTTIASDESFEVRAQETLGSATPELGTQPRTNITAWHGSSIRAGIFDDQNGLFWEEDGISLNAVQRSSTFQLAGLVNAGVGSNLVTGDGTCRFQDQLNNGDVVVIRGMTHSVTSILDNNRMTVVPPYRGVTNVNRVKISLRNELRVRQTDFNIDPIDGTGASGYNIDSSKMQMLMIEYSWYGAGYVTWGCRGQDGRMIHAHRRPNNNLNNEAYMRSGNLPARYEAINETATSSLSGAIDNAVTTITLRDATDYPDASVTYPVYVMIDSEIIKYSGKTGNDLTGCTRGATFTQWIEGASRSFTSSAAASHTDNTGVILISNTCTPLVNHWGSSVIMDGNFDGDEGYQFTYNRSNYGLPAIVGDKAVAFAMRLAPSVSNGIIGDLGVRDLINRAQLTLASLNVQVSAGRYLVEGILNPNNIDAANTTWQGLNTLGGGYQPSFSQFTTAPRFTAETTGGLTSAPYNTTGGFTRSGTKIVFGSSRTYANLTPVVVSSSGANARITVQLTGSGTAYSTTTTQLTVQTTGDGYAVGDTLKILGNVIGGSTPTNDLALTVAAITVEITGGERLFAIPVSATNQGVLELGTVKQIGTSAVPGTGVYPNGPELLAVQITALSTATNPVGEIQLSFQESQA